MVYGRINVNPENFMEEAIISMFVADKSEDVVPLQKNSFTKFRRTVFRSTSNSDYGKNLRWKLEKHSASVITGKLFSRNQLLNEGVEIFQNTDSTSTDILHEYFIPKDSVNNFIEFLKSTIPNHKADLLNITIRNIKKDEDTYLRYANEEVFGFVLLFNQKRNINSETEMKMLTQILIEGAISLNGTYYLPYRLHATREQFQKAYPQANEFFLLKKKYDTSELFNNKFYEVYH
jgi:hypothetical protein